MEILEAVTTVEVPVEALIKELGSRRAMQFMREITQCYDESIIEIKNGTKTLTVDEIERKYSKKKLPTFSLF